MKAKISKIESGRIWAKTVNPLGERPNIYDDFEHEIHFTSALMRWQQAESERIELELTDDSYDITGDWHEDETDSPRTFLILNKEIKIGDEIEVTREGNFFKII